MIQKWLQNINENNNKISQQIFIPKSIIDIIIKYAKGTHAQTWHVTHVTKQTQSKTTQNKSQHRNTAKSQKSGENCN